MKKIVNINNKDTPPIKLKPEKEKKAPVQKKKELTRRMLKTFNCRHGASVDRFAFERDGIRNILYPMRGLVRIDAGQNENGEVWVSKEVYDVQQMHPDKVKRLSAKTARMSLEAETEIIMIVLQVVPPYRIRNDKHPLLAKDGKHKTIHYPFHRAGLKSSRKNRIKYMHTFDVDANQDFLRTFMRDAIIEAKGMDWIDEKLTPRLIRKFRKTQATWQETQENKDFSIWDYLKYKLRLTKELPSEYLQKEYSEIFFKLEHDSQTMNDIMMSCLSACMMDAKDQKLGFKMMYELFGQACGMSEADIEMLVQKEIKDIVI